MRLVLLSVGLGVILVVTTLAAISEPSTKSTPPLLELSAAESNAGAESAAYLPPHRGGTVVWAVGDGADGSEVSKSVARMIFERRVDRFLYLGDVYETGTAAEYQNNYRPVYGSLDKKTAPTIGNHEYTNRATGYTPYWTRVHGRAPEYYAIRASGWQIISLNSEADHSADSDQLAWLRSKIETTPRFGDCRIAFWHQPRYSAGFYGDTPSKEPFWEVLADRARIVINGHEHDIQKMKPRRGINEFVSGAGGHSPRDTNELDPRLSYSNDQERGALRLEVGRESVQWRFVSPRAGKLADGRIRCTRN